MGSMPDEPYAANLRRHAAYAREHPMQTVSPGVGPSYVLLNPATADAIADALEAAGSWVDHLPHCLIETATTEFAEEAARQGESLCTCGLAEMTAALARLNEMDDG
jgi:hypothetical protein